MKGKVRRRGGEAKGRERMGSEGSGGEERGRDEPPISKSKLPQRVRAVVAESTDKLPKFPVSLNA